MEATETVGILPDFSVNNGRMESVKDAQGQSHALHNGPWQKTVEIELNRIGFDFLHFKCVDEP